MEGNLPLKIDWASLIVGSKFTVFAFFLVFEVNFPSTSPRGAYIFEGRFNGGHFASPIWGGLYLEGLIFGILRYIQYCIFYFFVPKH